MSTENSEKFTCPKCGEQELEDLEWGLKCRNCGFELQRSNKPRFKFTQSVILYIRSWCKYILLWIRHESKYVASLAGMTIYFIPLLSYFVIVLAICIYILWDTYHLMGGYPQIDGTFIHDILSQIILYILLLLAIMDLSALVAKQYIFRIKFKFFYIIPIPVEIKTPEDGSKEDREYLSKLIIIGVALIIMHVFHNILIGSDINCSGYLLGAAAVLIAVGVWKVLDSKGE